VVGYDLAAQYRRVVAELLAARKVVEAARMQWGPHGPCDNRLCRAVVAYDATPRAVLNHQPEPSKER